MLELEIINLSTVIFLLFIHILFNYFVIDLLQNIFANLLLKISK